MLPALAILAKTLAAQGLGLIGNAVLAKGKEAVEQKLGINLEDSLGTEAGRIRLMELQIERESDLNEFVLAKGEQDLRAEMAAQSAVTDRWKFDMASDSWLSKNIRPLVLIFLLTMVTLMAFLNGSTGFKPDNLYIELIGELLKLAFGAYFVGRSVEKGISMWKGNKA